MEVPPWRDEPQAGAAVIYFVIHMFRMPAFFLMAGLFARMLLERRGATAFVKDRSKRGRQRPAEKNASHAAKALRAFWQAAD